VKSVEQALNTPARDPMRAESNPATTMPRRPGGNRCLTMSGKAFWASKLAASSGTLPLLTKAKQIRPGMMNRYTGKSLRKEAKMQPRRAVASLGASRARWTMYWSVHQYHKPMTGAQMAMPSHGKLELKYHASLMICPASFFTSTGAQEDSTPAGMSGFQRLNMSEPQMLLSSPHPPSLRSP